MRSNDAGKSRQKRESVLAEKASPPLDHKIHFFMEKERRSPVGERVGMVKKNASTMFPAPRKRNLDMYRDLQDWIMD